MTKAMNLLVVKRRNYHKLVAVPGIHDILISVLFLCLVVFVLHASITVESFAYPTTAASISKKQVGIPFCRTKLYSKTSSHSGIEQESITRFLNTNYHSDVLVSMTMAFTEIGTTAAWKNAFSGGSYKVWNATVVNLKYGDDSITLDVQVRSDNKDKTQRVSFSLGW